MGMFRFVQVYMKVTIRVQFVNVPV